MKKSLANLVIFAIILTFIPCLTLAQKPDYSLNMFEDEQRMIEMLFDKATRELQIYDSVQLDSLIAAEMGLRHIPGVQICVYKDSQIVYSRSYGYANFERDVPVADTTLFMLASISKTFVANAAMQLWEDGLLDLNIDVNNYLPFSVVNPHFPDDSITMRMLLCHTSSIDRRDQTWVPDITWGYDYPGSLGEYLENYLDPAGANYEPDNYLAYQPGTHFQYSNYAFGLAGYIIERIAIANGIASSFEQYCQDSLFGPLGMDETSWFLADLDTFNIAMPYWFDSPNYIPYGHAGWPIYPCGQIRTSALQLARHMMSFMNYGSYNGVRILDSTTVDFMRTMQFPEAPSTNPEYIWWGIGWWYEFNTSENWGYWGHNGSLHGGKTLAYFDPEERVGMANLTNSTDDGTGMLVISAALLGFMRDPDDDAIVAGLDNCPFEYNPNQEDADDDGIGDICDNCPNDANEDQADMDTDGIGDICDNDVDGDEFENSSDNCPFIYNPDQTDSDLDSFGDSCDNCPLAYNDDQNDSDGDGAGDVCDICPGHDDNIDTDDDGYPDGCDNCPTVWNPDQTLDADADGVGDQCDNCPEDFNPFQIDWDWDNIGNECDNCPTTSNADQTDEDNDGDGDACDNYCCEPTDGAGDADDNGIVNLLDITYLISFLYKEGPEPPCYYQGDADVNEAINILDITYLISYLYMEGPEPACL